ncbi:MAG: flagellar basal body P-ring formation protein FlgA [Burkholderiales bacterium]|nr:flagellar basal body P-ring formation protein FlgA [Burkholderiales bacterium]
MDNGCAPCLPRAATRRPGTRRARAAWPLLLAPWLGASCGTALAQPAPPPVIAPQALALAQAQALAVDAARALAPPQARIVAEPGPLDPRLKLAPCERVEAYLPAGVPAWGPTRVGLRCAQGPVRWRVFVPLTVRVWAPGVVSAGALPAGAQITAAELRTGAVDWSLAGGAFARPAQLEGRVLMRPLAAGEALRPGDLQARQWFAAGDMVQVVAGGDGFTISTEAQAMSRGLEGQEVRVRTESGRVVVGRAVGDHRVALAL